ncbi:MAG: response regulator, partial [Oscillospiraceae bacterium]|nr:response regulator [Oscillospiraceae bacterium]
MDSTKKNSVLIVDDEDISAAILAKVLSGEYIIRIERSGQNAVETAEKFLPDVILLDIIMPEVDGYAVISELKQNPKTRNIPVIFTTSLNSPDDEEKGLLLGAADYITKPFAPEAVRLRVRNQVNMLNSFKEKTKTENMIQTLNEVAIILLSLEDSNFNETLAKAAEIFAKAMRLCRISVWRNDYAGGMARSSQIFRWVENEGGATRPHTGLQNVNYERLMPRWERIFKQGEVVNGPAHSMPEVEVLSSFGCKSLFVAPVIFNEVVWGFIMFEDRIETERVFTDREADILRSAATMVIYAINRNEDEQKTHKAKEMASLMLDSSPICAQIWDRNLNTMDCNQAAVNLYKFKDKQEYVDRFLTECSPEYQPDGRLSMEKAAEFVNEAFETGEKYFEWLHRIPETDEPMVASVTLARVRYGDDYAVVGYTRDLREQDLMSQKISYRNKLLSAENESAKLLISAEDDADFAPTLLRSMEIIGRVVNTDCVELWQNDFIEGELHAVLKYCWRTEKGVEAKAGTPESFPYAETPDWERRMSRNEHINGPVNQLPLDADFLADYNLESVLVFPIFMENRFWGICCIDDCTHIRIFTEEERNILQSACLMMASAINRNSLSSQVIKNREFLQRVLDNVPGMIFRSLNDPPKYSYVFVSQGCRGLLGYTDEELLSGFINFNDIVHPEDRVTVAEEPAFANKDYYEDVYRIIDRNGTTKWVWENSRVIEKDENGTATVIEGYIADITERQQLELAEASNKAKTQFLAHMSHEIRTPMNSIMGFAELAIQTETSPEVRGYLNSIVESSKWLLHIINDILDISKIESGKMVLDHTPFELPEVISRCQSAVLPQLKEKGIEMGVYAEIIGGKKLLGDPIKLYQALINLLSNAVKFTKEGKVDLSSKIIKSTNHTATIYFEVKDSGIGMTAEQIDKVFAPFIQADLSTTRNYGGTGLGLAITKNIIELMNGTLKVSSIPGEGSIFSFETTFETIDSADESTPPELINIADDDSKLEKPQFDALVLVCDDNRLNQQVACAHLKQVGIATEVAENGRVALNMVAARADNGEKPYDLIFMDMFMPVMDGMEAASKITLLNTGTPIVAMTANVMASEVEKYKANNMPDCLGKPFTSQELWRVLLRYLEPVEIKTYSVLESSHKREFDDETFQAEIKATFVKNNTNKHIEIAGAIQRGDLKRAHRLIHTLKSNAGHIAENKLQDIAEKAEQLLLDALKGEPVNYTPTVKELE